MPYTLITKELINKLNAPKDLRFRHWNETLDKQINTHKLLGGSISYIDDCTVALIDNTSICVISKNQFLIDNNQESYLMNETFKSIDISEIEIKPNSTNLFYRCKASKIYINNIKTGSDILYSMFKDCKAEIFGLDTIDFSALRSTKEMFMFTELLGNKEYTFKLNGCNADDMFACARAENIHIIYTQECESTIHGYTLFYSSQIKNLVIEAEKEIELHLDDMFQQVTIDNLILKNVTLYSERKLIDYFDDCNINKLTIRGKVSLKEFTNVVRASVYYGKNICIKQVDLGSYEDLIHIGNSKKCIDVFIELLNRLKAEVIIEHG